MTYFMAMCRLNERLNRTKDYFTRVALKSACHAMRISMHLDEASHLHTPVEVAWASANSALCDEAASKEAIEAALAIVFDTLDDSQEKAWFEEYLATRLN